MDYEYPREGTQLGEEDMQLNHESNRYEQTQDQRESGVKVVQNFHPAQPPRELIEVGGRGFGRASQVREEILGKAHENLAKAQLHLVEGMEWLEITGLLNTSMEEKHNSLKRLISDLIEDVEGMRKVYVHPPKM